MAATYGRLTGKTGVCLRYAIEDVTEPRHMIVKDVPQQR